MPIFLSLLLNPHKPGGKGSRSSPAPEAETALQWLPEGWFLEAAWAFVPLIYREGLPWCPVFTDAGLQDSVPSAPSWSPCTAARGSPLATPGASATAVQGSNSSYRSKQVGERKTTEASLHLPYISGLLTSHSASGSQSQHLCVCGWSTVMKSRNL